MGAPELEDDVVVPSSPPRTQKPKKRRSKRFSNCDQDSTGTGDDDTVPGSPQSFTQRARTPREKLTQRRRIAKSDPVDITPHAARNSRLSAPGYSHITPGTVESLLSEDLDMLINFKTPTLHDRNQTPMQQPKRIKVEGGVSPPLIAEKENAVELEFTARRPGTSKESQDDVGYGSGQFAMMLNRVRRPGSEIFTNESTVSVDTTTDSLAYSGVEGSFYGLPHVVKTIFETERGIRDLYDWQRELLSTPQVEAGQNVLLSLPTSGGKTLIAEVLLLRTILNQKKNCLFILPYVSIVQEKVRALAMFGMALDFLVEEYAGSKGSLPPQKRRIRNSVYIATIEKACGIVHHLVKEGRLNELGLVVVDEVHMLGESNRGATLEMTLTKVLHCAPHLQIVGMSATIGNLEEVGRFLRAFVYKEKFRPVTLKEYVVLGREVYEPVREGDKLIHNRTLHPKQYTEARKKEDPDLIGHLVLEVIPLNSVLIFCPSRQNCENVAKLVIKSLPRKKAMEHRQQEKKDIIQTLKQDSGGRACPVLMQTIPFGVAYHHSGLTDDERRLIEEAFLNGVLCVICCTSTLAAGVNLPARRVILRSPYVGREFLTRSRYKQMAGRAGRAGFDSEGESYLICDHANATKVLTLFDGPAENAVSGLNDGEGYPLRYFLLSCVVENVASTAPKMLELARTTLWALQASNEETVTGAVTNSLRWLIKEGLLRVKSAAPAPEIGDEEGGGLPDVEWAASDLGRAAIKGCISLDQARILYDDLQRGLDALVLNTPLHILFLLTPYEVASEMNADRNILYDMYHRLSPHDVRVFDFVGITPLMVQRYFNGRDFGKDQMLALRRLYCALMLLSMWRQGEQATGKTSEGSKGKTVDEDFQPIWNVASEFSVDRGRVQLLLARASSFGSNVLHFVQELEPLNCYANLLPPFVERIGQCSTMELVPLMQLPAVKRGRARLLFDAGYKTLVEVARAKPADLVTAIGRLSTKTAKEIVISAQMLLTENALNLQEAADSALSMIDQFAAARNRPPGKQS